MHESHVAAELVSAANRVARSADATISRVRLRIGADSHILPDSLRWHFLACATGSPAESAAIVIEKANATEAGSDGVTLISVTLEDD